MGRDYNHSGPSTIERTIGPQSGNADVAEAVGVSVSTANERVRRLAATGVVAGWRGVLDPEKAGAGLCAFVLLDVGYDGEEAACGVLTDQTEVQEVVKPLSAVQRTETILSLSTLKETTAVKITPPPSEG